MSSLRLEIAAVLGEGPDIGGVVPDAPLGSAYTAILTGFGGQEPYTFTGQNLGITAGALADGHTGTDNGDGTFTIAGTATTAETAGFTITMEDATRHRVAIPYSYRVDAGSDDESARITEAGDGRRTEDGISRIVEAPP